MIAIEGLSLQIAGRAILDGITLAIGSGESVGLIGPNGSGKTSLLRCLLGLVPFRGRVTIGGHDVWKEPVAAKRLLSWLPQKPAFGDLTALEALRFTARLRGIDRGRIDDCLARVGLERHAGERARTFSGGMQQRLALALTLLADAPVLLLDEPTASLDREAQEVFDQVVDELRGKGRTLVLASHRVEEIERLTGRVIELDRGRMRAACGTTEAVAEGIAPVVAFTGKRERR